MHLLETDAVEILDVTIRYHADVDALVETHRRLCVCVLLKEIVFIPARCDVGI